MNTRGFWTSVALVMVSVGFGPWGCQPGGASDGGDVLRADLQPPPPGDGGNARCVISADCPSGTYCDLGECIQQCNTRDRCTGALTCTPRGACNTADAGPADPPPAPPSGAFTLTPDVQRLAADTTSFELTLRGSGAVRYRIETPVPWLTVTSTRGVFDGEARISVRVETAAVPRDASAATIRVVTTQGTAQMQVLTPETLSGVYQGSLRFDQVRVDVGGMPRTHALALGSSRFGVHVAEARGVVSARIDTARTLLWPASATGAATGTGELRGDDVTLQLAQVLDATAAVSILPDSPSVFGSAAIGRELQLTLRRGPNGVLTGAATERIHGLTGTPIELVGSVILHRVPEVRPDEFTVGTAPTMPPGTMRGMITLPGSCFSPPDCSPSNLSGNRVLCVANELALGFPLHRFIESESAGSFALPPTMPSMTPTMTPYAAASDRCTSDLGTDLRRDVAGGAMNCASSLDLTCALGMAIVHFATTNPLRVQAAHDAARAWGELFSLIGNESMVQAFRAPYGTGASIAAIRQRYVAARRAYDAGLTRIFRAAMFEELRAMTPAQATDGVIPGRANDRLALRRIADLLAGSLRATGEIVRLDSANASDRATLRASLTRDAVLQWFATAMVADLDARWRPAMEPAPEVVQLGAVLTTLDDAVAALDPGNTPLGIPRWVVPILARTSPTDVQTNYVRQMAEATAASAMSTAADTAARTAVRTFDIANDQIEAERMQAETTSRNSVLDLCGNDFAPTGSPLPTDVTRCGATAGLMHDQILAVQQARQRLASAVSHVGNAEERVRIQRETMIRVARIQAEQIAFVDSSNREIHTIEVSQIALHAAQRGLEIGANSNLWNAFAPAAMAVVAVLIESGVRALDVSRADLQREQGMRAMQAMASETYVREMATLQNLMLEVRQAEIDMQAQTIEVARALSQLGTLQERALRTIADYRRAVSWSGRRTLNDPSFRIERDQSIARARAAFERAQRELYFAVRAMEYETNTSLPALTQAVFSAVNAEELGSVRMCVERAWADWLRLVSSTNSYTTEISLRRDVLGIAGPRMDPETGVTVSPGEQFRRRLFAQPYVRDGRLWPAIQFSTNLRAADGLFSSLVCNDRIERVQAQLVGDFLGDNQAEVLLLADGNSLLRSCAPAASIQPWRLRPEGLAAPAAIQAGVNSFGMAEGNLSLLGFSVAQSNWIVTVPDATTSPANRDVDPTHIDDIVLRVTHTAVAAGAATGSFSPTCR